MMVLSIESFIGDRSHRRLHIRHKAPLIINRNHQIAKHGLRHFW